MTDGTTGFQVAPVTEDEMNKVRSILERAVNAVVDMSRLAADVESLRSQVAQLTDDQARLRRTNDALEETVSNHRRQRQELEEKLRASDHEKYLAQADRDDWHKKADVYREEADRVGNDLATARRDRDDAQLRVMELEDELTKLKSVFDKLRDAFGAIPAPAVPKADPAPPSVGEVVQTTTTPQPQTTEVEPPRHDPPTRRIYTEHWSPGAMWDQQEGRYYTEVPF